MIEKGCYLGFQNYFEFPKQEIEEAKKIINEFPEIKKIVCSE